MKTEKWDKTNWERLKANLTRTELLSRRIERLTEILYKQGWDGCINKWVAKRKNTLWKFKFLKR